MTDGPTPPPRLSLQWPGGMVAAFARSLRRTYEDARRATTREEERDRAAVAILLAVTMVETFLNAYCQQLGQRAGTPVQLAVLSGRDPGLQDKLNTWPNLFLGAAVDVESLAWKDFLALKSRRDSLMHVRAGAVSLLLGPQAVPMIDASRYDGLLAADATTAARVAIAFMEELLVIGHDGNRSEARRELELMVGPQLLALSSEAPPPDGR